MIKLKELEYNCKGDYIHALFYFIKQDSKDRGFDCFDDCDYEAFYFDIDSTFSLDDLKGFISLLSSDIDYVVSSIILLILRVLSINETKNFFKK